MQSKNEFYGDVRLLVLDVDGTLMSQDTISQTDPPRPFFYPEQTKTVLELSRNNPNIRILILSHVSTKNKIQIALNALIDTQGLNLQVFGSDQIRNLIDAKFTIISKEVAAENIDPNHVFMVNDSFETLLMAAEKGYTPILVPWERRPDRSMHLLNSSYLDCLPQLVKMKDPSAFAKNVLLHNDKPITKDNYLNPSVASGLSRLYRNPTPPGFSQPAKVVPKVTEAAKPPEPPKPLPVSDEVLRLASQYIKHNWRDFQDIPIHSDGTTYLDFAHGDRDDNLTLVVTSSYRQIKPKYKTFPIATIVKFAKDHAIYQKEEAERAARQIEEVPIFEKPKTLVRNKNAFFSPRDLSLSVSDNEKSLAIDCILRNWRDYTDKGITSDGTVRLAFSQSIYDSNLILTVTSSFKGIKPRYHNFSRAEVKNLALEEEEYKNQAAQNPI